MLRQAKYLLLLVLAFPLANLAPSHGRQKIAPIQPPIVPGSNIPGKATLVSPSGTIATNTPTYTWNAVPLATWYYLWVNDSANASGKITQWYTATQAGCAAGTGTCSVTSTTTLANGAAQWWIQTWNDSGYGPWSDGMPFIVTSGGPPGKATLLSPSGSITTDTPSYIWNAVAGATWYYLWVNDGGSASNSANGRAKKSAVILEWYTASQTGCPNGTGTCSVTPSIALSQGAGQWWVQTWNPNGYGPWSDGMPFTVTLCGPPGKATTVSPSGNVYTNTPTYAWNAAASATYYQLWVNDSTTSAGKIKQWYTATQAGCPTGTGTCSVTPSTILAPGNGRLWVQTWNNCGFGPWSDGMEFAVTQWAMFGHDPSHTRRSPYKGPSSPVKRWEFETQGSVSSSPAVAPDGTIYVGSSDGNVYALDPETGMLIWKYNTGSYVTSSPAIGPDGKVYVGSSNAKLYAFNGATGVKVWEYQTGNGVYSSPAIGTDGTVYVGSSDGNVYALDPETGLLIWKYNTGSKVNSSPAIGPDGKTYVGSSNGKLHAFNGATGVKVWEYQTGGPVESSPAIGSGGTVYVGSDDGKLYALNGATGAKQWEYQAGSYVTSSPAMTSDNAICFGSHDGKVRALNGTTGSKVWEYQTGFPVTSSPTIGSDGTVYVGSHNGKLYAINGTNGVKRWEYQTGGGSPASYIHSSPAIAANGTLYFGASDRKIYALLYVD